MKATLPSPSLRPESPGADREYIEKWAANIEAEFTRIEALILSGAMTEQMYENMDKRLICDMMRKAKYRSN